MHRILMSIAVLLASAHAGAVDMNPGLWEVSLETRTDAAPGFQPAPFTLQQCIRPQDAANPAEVLGKMSNPGATGCSYSNKSWRGNVFHFTMTCSGSYSIVANGEINVAPTTLQGNLRADATVAGERTSFTNKLNARRIGGC